MDDLTRFQQLVADEKDKVFDQVAQYNKVDFNTFFHQTIVNQSLKTLAMSFDAIAQNLKIQLITSTLQGTYQQVVNYTMNADTYCNFCRETLKLDPDRKFNDSSNVMFKGIPARIFAITAPYSSYPLIVISTAKTPPKTIPSLTPIDETRLKKVLQGSFLIAGKSGAGKTYLLNYLLNKYYPKTKRLGIIQEFSEIYPPNDFTDILCTPPRVPGQPYNDLEFLAEQSNLMRYDTILVGEIKSSEAWSFVVNCASGTKGGCTIHGTNAQKALQRLRTLCLLAKSNLKEKVVEEFIKDAIDYVVYVEDGRVKDICQLMTVNNGNFQLSEVKVDVADADVYETPMKQQSQQQPMQPRQQVPQKKPFLHF